MLGLVFYMFIAFIEIVLPGRECRLYRYCLGAREHLTALNEGLGIVSS